MFNMKLYKEDNQSLPAWQLLLDSDTPPINFTESILMSDFDRNAFGLGWDYKCIRDAIKKLVSDIGGGDVDAGFALLSDSDKTIACKYKIGSDAPREDFIGVDALVQFGDVYNSEMNRARLNRANHVVSEISNRLPTEKNVIMGTSAQVFALYKDYGTEGTAYGDPISGVADYIDGTGDFVGNGLRQSGYTPLGLTLTAFCDLLIDILLGNGKKC